jgi:cyanophycinase
MKKILIAFSSLFVIMSFYSYSRVEGSLFIIGGGHRSESMMKKFIELANQPDGGKIVIFPMASGSPDEAGQSMVEEFKKLGVHNVEYHNLNREQALKEDNVKILDNVCGVYFSGGDQSRLTEALVHTPIHHMLLEIYKQGGVIGGTSAGAAVMSEIMITGEEKREVKKGDEFEKIQANNIIATPGFGFIKTAIIDQHFVARKRHNRLISLVAENPELLGIGIDESTAIIVKLDQTFEVIGEQNVIVYDASQAKINILPSHTISGFNIIMHILKARDKFDLNKKKVMR